MVGMIVFGRMGQNQRGFETAKYLDQETARANVVHHRSVRHVSREQFRSNQSRAGYHFFPPRYCRVSA